MSSPLQLGALNLGYIQDRATRPLALRRIEAHRRAVSLRKASLYIDLRGQGLELAGNLDPGAVLDYFQDQALFEYPRRYGAFRGICLNEEFREELEGPMRGDGLDDYTILSRLRDRGTYWRVEIFSQETGHSITPLWEMHYPHKDGYSPDILDDLLHADAFFTPAIDWEFWSQGIVSAYRIFRALVDSGRNWDANRQIWTLGTEEDSGNLDNEGEEQVTPVRDVARES